VILKITKNRISYFPGKFEFGYPRVSDNRYKVFFIHTSYYL